VFLYTTYIPAILELICIKYLLDFRVLKLLQLWLASWSVRR